MIPRGTRERGLAVLAALLAGVFVAGLGLCLVLVADTERLTSASFKWSSGAMSGADAMLEWAILDLAPLDSWTTLPGDAEVSSFTDASHLPAIPGGGHIDLDALTLDVQAETDALGATADRPRWRLYAWGLIDRLAGVSPAHSTLLYGAVWIADDPFDGDGLPAIDANGEILVHAEAFGPSGARRGVEAVLVRALAPPPPGGVELAHTDESCGIELALYLPGGSHRAFGPQFRQAAHEIRPWRLAAGRDVMSARTARVALTSGTSGCGSAAPGTTVRRLNWREVR